ncbi:MAG: UvrB/UvrC motif-containing protein [Clostridiales bacterium]|nr:UvrB/UvrC motif-containing protein [Clostridiales bacterium]
MKCQRCKQREANVQIVQQESGKKPQTFMLCDVCARELGIQIPTFPTPIKVNNPFAVMGNAFQTTFGLGADEHQKRRVTRCIRCNLSFDEFRKTGFLGCPDCYEAFGTQLDPVLSRTQMGKKHIGRQLGVKTTRNARKNLKNEAEPKRVQLSGTVTDSDLSDPNDNEEANRSTETVEDMTSKAQDKAESKELKAMEKSHRSMLINQKTQELHDAVDREDYLTAAKLRDEIAELKKMGE